MTTTTALYLEDLAVGDIYTSSTHELTTEEIIEYATQFDPQPFHTDEEAAGDTFFAGLTASGWHTASLTMKLVVTSVPFAQGIIGAGGEIKRPAPTRPGETMTHVESKIATITASRSKQPGLIELESLTKTTMANYGNTCSRRWWCQAERSTENLASLAKRGAAIFRRSARWVWAW